MGWTEATDYVGEFGQAWKHTPGASAWLAKAADVARQSPLQQTEPLIALAGVSGQAAIPSATRPAAAR